MTCYLDSSALVKLVLDEPESGALRAWLGGRDLATSMVGRVELERAARRHLGEVGVATAERVLDELVFIDLDVATAAVAAWSPPPALRALDAIHLATARHLLPELDAFVCYDRQLARAAADAGLPVAAPA